MKLRFITVILIYMFFQFELIKASPWAEPGDSQLRSDVEILYSAGLIEGPINNWPISWKHLTRHLYKADAMDLPQYVQGALTRVRAKIPSKINIKAKSYATNEVDFFRNFEDAPRGETEVEGTFQYNLENTSINVNVGYDDNLDDVILDGTYLSQELGNWSAYVGAVERWWGPGRETTTILSTNARPIPSIGIRRVTPEPFENKWLSWLGQWQWDMFVSKLEKERHFPRVVFIGMKLSFEPADNFEVGLARTLMLCGEGRPCGSKQWINGLIGLGDLDNIGPTPEQPGNQLGQIDLSYSFKFGDDINAKVYAEGSAEDLIVIVPYTYSRILGATINGPLGENGDSWRVTAEVSDTTGSLAWLYGEHRKGIMYNHHIYRDGYRYYNRVIGHSLDTNSIYYSLHAVITKVNGLEIGAKYQNILVNSENDIRQRTGNRLSVSRERINSFTIELLAPTKIGKVRISGRIMDNNISTPLEDKFNVRGGVSWELGF